MNTRITLFTNLSILIVACLIIFQTTTAFSAETELVGIWKISVPSKGPSGEPCPFVPDSMQFFADQTMTMSNFGPQHLPYKTTLTKDERQTIENKIPGFKGKKLLLIKPAPNLEWTATPMMYAYSVAKNELTLILQGWSPAKFSRQKK